MDLITKAVAQIEEADADKPNGGFVAVLSTPSLDRDGDRLHRDEWVEPLPDRLPLDIDHGMSVADTIGSFRPYFDGEKMMMDASFASTPRAQEVRALIREGHISTVSIAFMTDKSKKESGGAFREILNAGVVATPSNRDAVILASKAAQVVKHALARDPEDDETSREVRGAILDALGDSHIKQAGAIYVDVIPRLDEDALKRVFIEIAKAATPGAGGDAALVGAIHDASVHLGAQCIVMEPEVDPDTGASSGANKSVKAADVRGAVAGLDAIIDEAVKLSAGINREGLPGEVGQALDLLVGAQKSVADIMEQLGVFDPDNPDGKSVGFTDQTGQRIEFDSHSDAREFFTRMLASLDSAETSEVELVEVIVTDDLEAFEKALDQALTPEDSPADEAAAPSDEERAPADKAADEKAKRARQLQLMQMRATTPFNFIEGTN